MFSKDSQYISVLKLDTQLKVDFKKLKNENLDLSEESTFIIHDEILTRDIASKLNQWQKNISKTYISTLCLCDDEKIINKTNKKLQDYKKASLNSSFDVVIKSSKLFEVEHYFEFTGLDYVFSPFQILNLHLEQNPCSNSLIVFTVSNYVYIIIVNELNRIVYNKIYKLSDFKDIKKSHFYTSDVVGQKLYDEIYALELQNSISKALKEYYSKKTNNFIEKIDILYNIKQLSDEQIQAIEDDILINVHYHYISLKDSIYELTRSSNANTYSYVKPRIKKASSFFKWFILSFITLGLFAGLGFYYQNEVKKSIDEIFIKKEEVKSEVVKKEIKVEALPNHINFNNQIKSDIKILLDVIPFDMLVDSLEIKKENSTISGKMISPDSYIKDIQPQLLNIYKYSNIQVKDSKNIALDVTIYNNELIKKEMIFNEKLPKYINDGFMPEKRVTDQLKIILPKSAVLKFESTFNLKISTYNYRVNILLNSPVQFYELLDNLNKEKYSINVSYPIVFLKNEDFIEVDFGLQFHQNL